MINKTPYIIAGPCSAESFDQLEFLASKLKSMEIDVFRAGAWKPRTRPNSFEGYGEEALKWLEEIRTKFALPVAIEVASAEHAELALKYDIDVLWLGTRTTASPITVESIAKALENTSKTVIIKNPICPDIDLWIGAMERFQNNGIHNLMAIHRGFKVYEQHQYRSQPYWDIPLEFRRIFPNIPMLLDPSHIAGDRNLISDVIEESNPYPYEGMMIEVHHSPDDALSDKNQQIKPERFQAILEKMQPGKIRQAVS